MNIIKKWLENHNISSHTITSVWGVACILWATSQPFKNYIYLEFQKTPRWLHEFVVGVLVPAALYFKSQKKNTDA
jgi:hypothetical protein